MNYKRDSNFGACGMDARDSSFQVLDCSFPDPIDACRALSNAAIRTVVRSVVGSGLSLLFGVLATRYCLCM